MHVPILRSLGAFLALFAVLVSSFPVFTAEAQSRSYGDQDSSSRRGVSATTQKKIRALDNNSVEELSIPILLGVSLKQIYSDFGDPRGGGTREHEGQDLLAPRGAYIVSPTEAVVLRAGNGESSGKYVYTANPGGETFVYMHLDNIADDVKAGAVLKKGDLIGYVGDTGNAKGGATHLHFEIREGRNATDPYPRLKGEFTLKERMAALTKILKDSEDEEEEADALVKAYRGLFVAALAQDIDIPEAVEDILSTSSAVATGFVRDLTLGSQGADVVALQTFLIAEDKGAKADTLSSAGATGYFGSMTQAALIEYQLAAGISPASGYFGSLTRARMAAGAN